MDPAIRPPLQRGSPTRLAVSPGPPLTVQKFLRNLKKSTSPLATPGRLETAQENALKRCQLTVQAFLHGLRKPLTPPRKPAEAAEVPKLQMIASTGLEDLQYIATASGPGLLDAPEPTPNKIDGEQVLSLSPETKRLRTLNPRGEGEKDVSMRIPKVTQTYTKKAKHVSPQQNDSPALSLTQRSMHQGRLIDDLHDNRLDSSTEQLASREASETEPVTKHTLAIPRKRKRQPLQEEIHRVDRGEDDADTAIRENKRKRRKRRRAPINELALVADIQSLEVSAVKGQVRTSCGQHFIWVSIRQCAQTIANFVEQKAYDSDNAIDLLDAYLDEQGSAASTSPSCGRSQNPGKANVGKPVTRIRQEITIPKREVRTREGFRFPPITPRATKSPGWRLGSGFEGFTLDISTNKRPDSRKRKVRHARNPCFLGRSLPKLEMSTRLSPTRQSVSHSGITERHKDRGVPIDTREYEPAKELDTADGAVEVSLPQMAARTGGKAAFEQTASLTALICSPVKNDQSRAATSLLGDTVKESNQLRSGQTRNLDASQAIREPSRSERNGWLKRKRGDLAVADEDDREQFVVHTQRTSVDSSEHGRDNRRISLDTYFEGTGQAQQAFGNFLHNGGGQTTPNAERPIISQQKSAFQDEQSAEQHQHLVSNDAEEHDSDSENEILDNQSSNSPPQPPPSWHSEAGFPASPLHAKGQSMPTARPHVEVPRTSEIPETQERLQESIELDHTRTEFQSLGLYSYRIPATTLDSGKYFSRAVQQIDSPEKIPHTVTRHRSRQEPVQDVRGSQMMGGTQKGVSLAPITGERTFQKQEGSLELGVTPRLKRRMSNVPFRPPFKEPL